jgi:hypothetical protein
MEKAKQSKATWGLQSPGQASLPEGARGIATEEGITSHEYSAHDPSGAVFVPCFRCGAVIKTGSPVSWPTVGANKGRYNCPRSVCGKPGPSKKTSRSQPGAVVIPKAEAEAMTGPGAPVTLEQVKAMMGEMLGGNPSPEATPKPKAPTGYMERASFDGEIEALIKSGERNFLLIGGTGTGKTEFAKAYADKKGLPSLICSMTMDNPIKEFLVKLDIKNGSTSREAGELVKLFKKPSVVCLDEFNFLPPKYQSKFFELLNNGQIFLPELGETITRHPENILILTSNPSAEAKYRGTEALNVAIVERVELVVAPEFTQPEIIKITGCSPVDAKFIDHIRRSLDAGKFNAVMGLRVIKRFKNHTALFGLQKALSKLDDVLNYEDPRVKATASNSAIDFYPELTGNKGGK